MYPFATARMNVVGGGLPHGRIARDRDLIAVVAGAAALLGLWTPWSWGGQDIDVWTRRFSIGCQHAASRPKEAFCPYGAR